MRALNRKLLRDVRRLWAQLLAAALVMSCGVATLTMSLSTLSSLQAAQQQYYERYRFPHVFTHVKRAPMALVDRIEQIPGVARVQPRVVVEVNLDVEGLAEPAVGRIISIPDRAPFGVSELHLRRGRLPERGRGNEVVASEAFVEAHGFTLGTTIRAVINGTLEELRIVGVALSPEYIYQVRPGEALPDDKHFGVFWMNNHELAPAFDLDGAFNDLAIVLTPHANESDVLARLDRLTAPYGGEGAYGRSEQLSHKFLSNELDQLRAMSILPPSIFLSATAFILNIIFSRVVRTQREQVAALKAFGYGRGAIAMHYLGMALVTTAVGSAMGVTAGWLLGGEMTRMYARFFRFPVFDFALDERAVLMALSIAGGAAVVGTLAAVRMAANLPPAEAMRPEAPPDYRASIVERLRVQRLLTPVGRMVLRHIERRPMRALMTSFGISLSIAVLIVGSFMHGALDHLIEFMFSVTQRQDITVTLFESASPEAAFDFERLPGVLVSEPFRAVPARIRAGPISRLQGIIGVQQNPQLNRVVDENSVPVEVPTEGLLLSDILADVLDVQAGDVVTVEILTGQRPVTQVPVTAVVSTYIGTAAYMDARALHRLMREGDVVSGAYLDVDEAALPVLYHLLKTTPAVATVTVKQAALESFKDTIAENILRMRLFNTIFATIIAFGVIFNSARIALAERAHELATMRVLGFTRVECSVILLSELGVLTVAAIPLGLLLGRTLAFILVSTLGGETVRIPFEIHASTYGFAIGVVLLAAFVSGMIVRRGVDRLDLIEVLKTKA